MGDKPEGKGTLGRRKLRWKGSTETDLKEIGWDCVNWTQIN
jgi:hypothetical protein